MFRPSDFGARYTRRTAAAELMLDTVNESAEHLAQQVIDYLME